MAAEGVAAREAAVALLNAVMGEGVMLSDLPEPDLPAADRARARRLADQVIRQIEPVDKVLDKHLRKEPPLGVMNALRLAVVEISQGAAPYGVVNSVVTLLRKDRRNQHMAGLANAVLRKIEPEALAKAGVQKLPRWLRQPLVHLHGREAVAAMEALYAKAPPLDLTLKPSLPEGTALPEGELLPNGSLRLQDHGQISALPGYAEGHWWVQDAAASMPARLLDVKTGERVLDLCAAPGGKTMQLAAAAARVTALDISPARLKRISENLVRTGLTAEIVTADALDWQPEGQFDAILLDAPCSATGTIRRHPELPFLKDGSEIEPLAALQAELLDRALGWLKPGGRLVFATCSLLPEEGEAQITSALERHKGLRVERPSLAGIEEGWWSPEGGLRLRPDYWAERGGMDGFYMALLRKG